MRLPGSHITLRHNSPGVDTPEERPEETLERVSQSSEENGFCPETSVEKWLASRVCVYLADLWREKRFLLIRRSQSVVIAVVMFTCGIPRLRGITLGSGLKAIQSGWRISIARTVLESMVSSLVVPAWSRTIPSVLVLCAFPLRTNRRAPVRPKWAPVPMEACFDRRVPRSKGCGRRSVTWKPS